MERRKNEILLIIKMADMCGHLSSLHCLSSLFLTSQYPSPPFLSTTPFPITFPTLTSTTLLPLECPDSSTPCWFFPSFSVPLPLRSFLSPYSCSPRQHSPIAPYKTSLIDRTVSWRNFWSLLPQLSNDGMSGLFLYHWKVDGKILLLTLLKLFVVHQFLCF